MNHIHFIGICGTAMASVAVMFKQCGIQVTGSDQNVYPPMSTFLAENGIDVKTGYSPANLEPAPDIVVIGNAISRGNPEVEAVLERHLNYASLPEMLRENFIRGRTSVVITGTHGKTTTTSLVAWLLHSAGKAPGFMVGGIPLNFGTSARLPRGEIFVCEGDEYDTAFFDKRSKFLNYLPDMVVINNLEFDHADIFDSLKDIQKSFRQLVNLIPRTGRIWVNGDDENALAVVDHAFCPVETFGFSAGCDWQAVGIHPTPTGTRFNIRYRKYTFPELTLPLWGNHNVKNALAATALSYHLGLKKNDIRHGLATFQGVKRRLEQLAEIHTITLYDDFAHHPTAIRETLIALRHKHPNRRLVVALDPRSNTMVRHFHQETLPVALAQADVILFNDLHRKDTIEVGQRLHLDPIVQKLTRQGKIAHAYASADEILSALSTMLMPNDVVVLMSNGGFGGIHQHLINHLQRKPS
ncbi:MAG: UDP-N-acetylmuramate:L-alanyl-gamma-D-glutamyl-meso-diaminopimelate ligase [Gemmatimonadetes bacterium]|nr:MAG: UDP-N-acetylmuramate:L-alanyl-gamma-D-glutamyl-meso-diaminopimelate ligase [Gemmatimonadota bacterium]